MEYLAEGSTAASNLRERRKREIFCTVTAAWTGQRSCNCPSIKPRPSTTKKPVLDDQDRLVDCNSRIMARCRASGSRNPLPTRLSDQSEVEVHAGFVERQNDTEVIVGHQIPIECGLLLVVPPVGSKLSPLASGVTMMKYVPSTSPPKS